MDTGNGTSQSFQPPPWPSSETTVPLRGSRPGAEPMGQYTTGQHSPSSNSVGLQAPTSQPPGSVPAWNPAALLQPSRRGFSATDLRNLPSGRPQPMYSNVANGHSGPSPAVNDPMVFQFTSASDTSSNGHISGSSTPTPPNGEAPTSNGVGLWIERMNNVQPRSNVRHPKRRKTEDPQDFAVRAGNMSIRGSSGALGEYVRDKQQEAHGSRIMSQTPTVDLTDGTVQTSFACYFAHRRVFILTVAIRHG
jgi:hypothetical protein